MFIVFNYHLNNYKNMKKIITGKTLFRSDKRDFYILRSIRQTQFSLNISINCLIIIIDVSMVLR